MNKLLTSIIIILFLAVCFEFYYYQSIVNVYQNSYQKMGTLSQIKDPNLNFQHDFTATSTPIVVVDHKFSSGSSKYTVVVHGNTPYFLDNVTTGKVTKVHFEKGVIPNEDVKYRAAIEIEGVINGRSPIWILFDESDFQLLRTYKLSDKGDRIPISLNEIKEGDIIIDRESYDLVNKKTAEITIIKK